MHFRHEVLLRTSLLKQFLNFSFFLYSDGELVFKKKQGISLKLSWAGVVLDASGIGVQLCK